MNRAWLKLMRQQSKVKMTDITQIAGISRQYYNMLEAGSRNPSVAVAQKIATLLDFDWTLFFKSESETNLPVEAKEIVASK